MRAWMRLPRPTTQAMGRILILLVFGLTLAFGQSEGPQPTQLNRGAYAELAKVPAKEQARQNPLASDPDAVAAGGKLFEEHCSKCHGENAKGTREGPSLRVQPVRQATPGALFSVLTNGVVRRGMPVWSKLPEPERWQLVSFLKSLETGE